MTPTQLKTILGALVVARSHTDELNESAPLHGWPQVSPTYITAMIKELEGYKPEGSELTDCEALIITGMIGEHTGTNDEEARELYLASRVIPVRSVMSDGPGFAGDLFIIVWPEASTSTISHCKLQTSEGQIDRWSWDNHGEG